jgi:hypothetical protein
MVDKNTFAYTIGFVPAGDYRVAYTCDLDDAAVDADAAPTPPATAETVRFTTPEGIRVTVVGGGMHEVNFAAPGT